MSDDIKIKALKDLQLQYIEKEAKLFKQVYDLEVEFEKQLDDLYDKRQKIIAGGDQTAFEVAKVMEDGDNTTPDVEGSGIPNFWLTAFENSSVVGKIVEPSDKDLLSYLFDVRVMSRTEPMGFDLEFHFHPNKYFENSVLTKSYEMRCEHDPGDPFGYEGPEIVSCKGCKIAWKKGMNITLDKTKKKFKAKGSVRVVTKFNEVDSFFNFFESLSTPKRSDEIDEALEDDIEIGKAMRERIIPCAVLYYLDEASDESSDDEDEEADEADEDDDDESENTVEVDKTAENGGIND